MMVSSGVVTVTGWTRKLLRFKGEGEESVRGGRVTDDGRRGAVEGDGRREAVYRRFEDVISPYLLTQAR